MEMLKRRQMTDGGTLAYDSAFLAKEEADRLFKRLVEEVPWQAETLRGQPFPRLLAYYADQGVDYAYSGLLHRGGGRPEWLTELWARVEATAESPFNTLLLNRYRDGRDSIGFHSDDEPELGMNPVIASVTLGAERDFVLKHQNGEKWICPLSHGSLLVMGGTLQHHWKHGVPKAIEVIGERINLTFRLLLSESGIVTPAPDE
jgi:alkylated DNA repair dioxygenase AlkB